MGCFLDPRQDLTSFEKKIICMLFLILTREFVNLYGLGLVLGWCRKWKKWEARKSWRKR